MSLARATDLRPEDLAGRTWAGYVRESTKGQADRYGPEIQRTDPMSRILLTAPTATMMATTWN